MKKNVDLLGIIKATLGTFEHRQSFTPGMFEPLRPLLAELGYTAAAIYITDDYPDRMHRVFGYGEASPFPGLVVMTKRKSLHKELENQVRDVPGVMTAQLFSHDRELGAVAVVHPTPRSAASREAFSVLVESLSVMAYIERIRKNDRREREEREVFFAQSLTSRLLVREVPKMKHLRLGYKHERSLEAGGDFYDFVPEKDGVLFGFFGCCSGTGLRTVLEVTSIMRLIFKTTAVSDNLADILRSVNRYLVRDKRRAYQASLAAFRVDVRRRRLRLAKAGRLGMLVCGPGVEVINLTAPGSTFLGMIDKPEIHEDEYRFEPGQGLFAVTEGFYTSRNCQKAHGDMNWFLQAVEATLAKKRKIDLANAIFNDLTPCAESETQPAPSMLALSVEYLR
ncbi:MAG: SpoIIE family protein phosphatase [Planctomycetes bacterium]|nr:SpoIIE family protein phosphatase [Planctomycetota bacterium]